MIQEAISVLLGDSKHKKIWLESDKNAQSVLREAKNNKITPFCLCRVNYQGNPVAMHIKARDGHYSLCRNPGTGQEHHVLCSSHDDYLKLNGRSGLADSAVKLLDSGGLLVHPNFSLSIKKQPDEMRENIDYSNNNSIRHNRITLLGFMHLLHEPQFRVL